MKSLKKVSSSKKLASSHHSLKKSPDIVDNRSPWDKDLQNFDMEDPEFHCYITFFVESTSTYYGLMEIFNEEALNGKRWEIKVISKSYIKKSVLDHCTKSREKKPFNLLCDQILRYAGYEFKRRIPPNLLGCFIKYEIRRLKIMYKEYKDYQKEQEDWKEDKLKANSTVDSNVEQVRNQGTPIETTHDVKASASNKLRAGFLQKIQRGGGTPSKTYQQQQYGKRRPESELTKRDEDKRGKFYVKDYPIHGPQVYLVITTIYEQLPAELIEIMGVPVVAIIKVGHDQIECLEGDPSKEIIYNHLMELNQFYYESNCYRKKCNPEKEHANKTNEIETFWLDFNRKIQKPESSNYYGRTILGRYLPPLDKVDFESQNWKEKLQDQVYDDITQTLFNFYEIKELYNQYNNSIGVINIKIPDATYDCDMNLYNKILDTLENKYINVLTIFNSMISQVEESTSNRDSQSSIKNNKPPESTTQIENIRESILENILTKLNDEYHISVDSKDSNDKTKEFNNILSKNVSIKCPHHIIHTKYLEKNTDILKTIYSAQFEENAPKENLQTYKTQLNALQKALGTRQNKVLAELMIVMKTIENYHSQVRNTLEINKSAEEVNLSNGSQIWNKISMYNTLEELDSNVLSKILLHLNLSHNTCKSVYLPLLDSILFTFYNCQKNNSRTVALQTPLSFKDFFKYVLPQKKEWAQNVLTTIKNQTDPKLYQTDLNLLRNSKIENILTPVEITPKLKIDEKTFIFGTETDNYNDEQEIVNYLNEIEFPDKLLSTSKRKPLNTFEDIVINKDNIKKDETSGISQSLNENEHTKIYDLGQNQRVQFASKDVEALFRYDTKLRIKYRHKHYGRKTMTLELEVCGNRLYYSSNVHINDEKSKFMFVHRSGISFSFREWKNYWTIPNTKGDKMLHLTWGKILKHGHNTCQPITPIPKKLLLSTYSLTIKTPLDYTIEVKYLEEGEAYIKHSYLKPLSTKQLKNEYLRIFLRKNCIIKLLDDDNIEILYSSGKKIVAKWSNYDTFFENVQKLQEYTIYHGCGNISVYSEGRKIKESKVQIEETNFIFDHYLIEHENGTIMKLYTDGTQIVEFNDGTKFTSSAWTDSSIYDLDDASESSNITENYVLVYMKITVEQENYATMIYNEENDTTEIKITPDISLFLNSDNTYYIKMLESSSLSVNRDGIQLDKYLNNSLLQRSIIIPNILKYNYIPQPPLVHFFTKDIYGNELTIDTQSQIHYKYSLSRENAFCLKHVVNNMRHVLVRRDLSGFELHPNFRFSTLIDKLNKNNDLMIEDKWNAPFIKTTILFPTQKELIDKGNQIKLPSTYGTTYFFPFLIKENKSKKPLKFVRQLIKTLVSSDINKKYKEMIAKSEKIIQNQITISKCKCLKKQNKTAVEDKVTCKKPCKYQNIVIKNPGPDFQAYLKENILYNGLKRANFKITRPEKLRKFRNKRKEVLEKKIPPYFESAFGISYFIAQQIKDNVNNKIEIKTISEFENWS